MTKRSSRGRRGSQGGIIGILVLIAAAVIYFLFGRGEGAPAIPEIPGVDLGTLVPGMTVPAIPGINATTEGTPGAGGTTGGTGEQVSGQFWTVYFTDPNLYGNDVTSGGIELHLIDLINAAQSSVDLAVFEFNLQNVADALIAAHNRGVQVRIVYDSEHTADDPQMAQMLDAGIQGTPDDRSAFMHNKFFIIDKTMVWTGSWNLTTNDTFQNNNNAAVLRSQQLVQNYQTEFDEMFAGQFGPTSPANTPNPQFTLNGIAIENYFASEDEVMPALIAFARSAQTSIHFMAFSFTDFDLANAMIERHAADVEVVGIFEQRGSDTDAAECNTLREAGVDARLDGNGRTFHHKVIIIDGSAVAFGSFNWSSNATDSNDENLLIIRDPALAAEYEKEFQRMWSEAIVLNGTTCKEGT